MVWRAYFAFGPNEPEDHEVGDPKFIVQFGITHQSFCVYSRFHDIVDEKSGAPISPDITGKRSMEVRKPYAKHREIALGFVKIAVEDEMLLGSIGSSLPCSSGRAHGVDVADDEPAARLQDAKNLSSVGLEIGQVTLVEVGHGEFEPPIFDEAQVLHIGDSIRVVGGLQAFGGIDHRSAEVDTKDFRSAEGKEHSAKAAFAATAIQNVEAANVAACLEHRAIEEALAHGIPTFATFLDPGRRETTPLVG
jgi:hypothetical protein